ncbi:molecular chaperone SurA [Rhodoferax lacus]|uniref:Chaperone SurA n=1 Tax=Rhodoferax lacus TaxID=2184758 RepID=A0A3E1RB54_9BURK|nr:peptidylprolyl isomerase [Rhodoferax lacus]RFO96595.1 molecular chaperone SurA [Rhodoferax lacus]
MTFRLAALALAAAALLLVQPVQAQKAESADFVVALVNSEPITNSEVRAAIQRVTAQIKASGQPLPAVDEIRQGVLERLISDRAQLQLATETGVRIDDAAVDMAEQNLARQNQMDVDGLRKRMRKDGIQPDELRKQLRDQLTLTRLREREVDARVRISDQDVDRALAEQQAANTDPFAQEINLAQLLVAVPEKADANLTSQLQAQAQALLVRLRSGEDFAALVKQYSDADRSKAGEFGLRRADRYPPSFVQATQKVAVGAVSELVRSGAGFHILKVLERRAPSALAKSVQQTRARHILLRTSPELSAFAASAKLAALRQSIVSGKTDFAAAARDNSQDGSAAQGGDLGWANPGMFVPEFEEVMNQLKEGEISQPTVTRFGVHLIQLTDRRKVELSVREVREQVRNQLREARLDEAFASWARDVRERAYVELREPPQ